MGNPGLNQVSGMRNPLKANPMRWRIPILKRLIPSIRRKYARVFWKDGKKIVRAGTALFELSYSDFVDRQVAFYDDFEIQQLARLRAAIARFGCDTFIDVGANFGYYAVQIAAENLTPAILAYEPDQRSFDRLHINIGLNGLDDAITAHMSAVGGKTGTLVLDLAAETSTGQTKIASGTDAPGPIVNAIALDDELQAADRKIVVKIDVEGYELEVLSGMTKLLARNRCYLQVECFGENIPNLQSIMKAAGYRPDGTIDHDFYFTNMD